jgi:hypothetical protein
MGKCIFDFGSEGVATIGISPNQNQFGLKSTTFKRILFDEGCVSRQLTGLGRAHANTDHAEVEN